MKHSIISLLFAASIAGLPMFPALAANPHAGGTTGQPSQSCETTGGIGVSTFRPGNTFSSPGSPFNDVTPGTSALHYAGQPGTPSAANGSSNAVGQYDVACFQQSQKQLP
ncbi:adenylate cyclase [Hyphomicrobium sp.]|uniref:adenylate cyclase n=1 Tax=Hyphomicrobium sp. TaxID=82 RepID=UPI001D6C9E0E|nr:adenylate cyclase [Hyphomicrobium sp.]MBY0559781.1 adenylate cyclase [Hyphomicrobium sp.]